MLKIFICDDDPKYLAFIKKQVENYILMNSYAMEVVCAETSPGPVLKYLEENPGDVGLYFLDLHLNDEVNGISLATAIRKLDPWGFIIFITSDVKSYKLTFKHKVEAMDYIVKDDPELRLRIVECMNNATEKLTAKATVLLDNFVIKISEDIKHGDSRSGLAKDSIVSIDKSKILCFMTYPDIKHTVIVLTSDGRRQFAGSLKHVQASLGADKRFYRCQNNLIANMDKVIALDPVQGQLTLEDNLKIDIAIRKIKKLKEYIDSYNGNKK